MFIRYHRIGFILFLLLAISLLPRLLWRSYAVVSEQPASPMQEQPLPPAPEIPTPDPLPQLEVLPGTDVYILTGTPIPLKARVTDAFGQPVPQIPVTFQIVSGSGALTETPVSTTLVSTNELGEALTDLTVPTILEPTCLAVSIAETPPITAAFTGVPAESLQLIEVSGNNQVASPGQVLDAPFVVRVEAALTAPILSPCAAPEMPPGLPMVKTPAGPSHLPGDILQAPLRVPVAGVSVAAEIIQGEATFIAESGPPTGPDMAETTTNAQGEADFRLRAGQSEAPITTQISAQGQTLDFLTLVGLLSIYAVTTESNETIVALAGNSAFDAVLRIDPVTGRRTVVSGSLGVTIGQGPGLGFTDIAVDAGGGFLVPTSDSITRVDPVTGDRRTISGCLDSTCSVSVGRGIRVEPESIAIEPGGTLVVTDIHCPLGDSPCFGSLIRVSPTTGDRSVLSGCLAVDDEDNCVGGIKGNGPMFNYPQRVAVEAEGTLVVADFNNSAIFRVDPITGDRRIIGIPDGFNPEDIAIENDGTLLVAVEYGVERFDPVTGERTLLSGCPGGFVKEYCIESGLDRGQGLHFEEVKSVAVEAQGTILVADTGLGTVMRVDPLSGDRTIVSGAITVGNGRRFDFVNGLVVDSTGSLIIAADGAVTRINPISGDRTPLSTCFDFAEACEDGIGRGPSFDPHAIAIDANGAFVVADATFETVMRVNPKSGDREIISGCIMEDDNCIGSIKGGGPLPIQPEGMAAEPSGTFVVSDPFYDGLIRVNPLTGNRTVLTGCTIDMETYDCLDEMGDGPTFNFPEGIAVEAGGALVVADIWAIMRVDPSTGNRTIVSGCTVDDDEVCVGNVRGMGFPFESITDIAVDKTGDLLATDSDLSVVMRVDPVTGNRTLVSGCVTESGNCISNRMGTGPLLASPEIIAIEADGDLVVVDRGLNAIVRINPLTGDRTIISR